MASTVEIILQSGRQAVELALFVLLPVLVIMTALMRWLEHVGALRLLGRVVSPVTSCVGVPGTGVLAVLQILLVNFAAPVSSLRLMQQDGTAKRALAATLAMVLTMSQANAVFPLATVGLELWVIVLTSLAGGFLAAAVTYYGFGRGLDAAAEAVPAATENGDEANDAVDAGHKKSAWTAIRLGGEEGFKVVLDAIPILVLALFVVNALAAMGAIGWVERGLSPAFERMDVPGIGSVAFATKYVAGGTAMLGVTVKMIEAGDLTALELNRLAGFMINPLDLVGLGVLLRAGARVAEVRKPAIWGAAVGILAKGLMHLVIFA